MDQWAFDFSAPLVMGPLVWRAEGLSGPRCLRGAADLVRITGCLKRARPTRTRHSWSPFSAAADRRASALQVIESAVNPDVPAVAATGSRTRLCCPRHRRKPRRTSRAGHAAHLWPLSLLHARLDITQRSRSFYYANIAAVLSDRGNDLRGVNTRPRAANKGVLPKDKAIAALRVYVLGAVTAPPLPGARCGQDEALHGPSGKGAGAGTGGRSVRRYWR
jgi:hypothetical protein